MCCWTLRDTSNLQTMACARCGLELTVYERLIPHRCQCYRKADLRLFWSLGFCRRAWDQAIQQALSAVPPITSLLRYSEERIMVSNLAEKRFLSMTEYIRLYALTSVLDVALSCDHGCEQYGNQRWTAIKYIRVPQSRQWSTVCSFLAQSFTGCGCGTHLECVSITVY